ncbi:flippase [Haloferax sulfurifontis]|uniref:Polysaccharide biosynthesis transporter n=1 Tax=Haloferax sulfurifontis ATCC BAA-897 TaxID=662480 RepID=M0I105_9EURY|nr:flippase [Haloferax sulfurifontis]ELZ89064.1 polysaccharide biosynthesis transporter [Haloferax sulfurifontis ATCC BAA-897]
MKDTLTGLASISFVGKIIGRLCEYGLTALLAYFLGASSLGSFTVALVILRISGMVSRVGLDVAAQKYVPIYRHDPDSLQDLISFCIALPVIFGGILSVILFVLLSGPLGSVLSSSTTKYLVLATPLLGLSYVLEGIFRGFKDIENAVLIREIGISGIPVIVVSIVLALGGEIFITTIVYVLSLIVPVLIGIVRLESLNLNISTDLDLDVIGLLKFSLQASIEGSMSMVTSWIDILVLGMFVSSAKIGVYQVAFQTAFLLAFALVSVNSVFPAVASELYSENRLSELNNIYSVITKWVGSVTLLGGAFLILFADEILSIFGTEFNSALTPFILLVLSQLVAGLAGPVGYLLIMTGNERIQMINSIITAVLNLILNFALIPRFGIIGAAISTGFSIALVNVLRVIEVRYYQGLWPYGRDLLRILPAIIGGVVILYVGRRIGPPTVISMLLSGLVSGILFLILSVLSMNEKDQKLLSSIR